MTGNQAEQLSALISAANAIADETLSGFGGLSAPQLNWKPAADRWSVAQCFDHLVTANVAYFPVFDQVLGGKNKRTFWTSLPWLPGLWGKMLIKSVSPESARKLKAPKIFRPSASSVDAAIIRRFVDQQNQVVEYMKAMEGLRVEKIIIPSPVTGLIAYSVMDAYRVIVAHERRHLLQARRVTETEGFPQ
jgi:hypothetical protein